MSHARTAIDQHIDAFNNRTPEHEPCSTAAELVSPYNRIRDLVKGLHL